MWEWWNVFDVKDLIDRIKGEEEEEKKEIFAANGTEKTSFDSIPCEK